MQEVLQPIPARPHSCAGVTGSVGITRHARHAHETQTTGLNHTALQPMVVLIFSSSNSTFRLHDYHTTCLSGNHTHEESNFSFHLPSLFIASSFPTLFTLLSFPPTSSQNPHFPPSSLPPTFFPSLPPPLSSLQPSSASLLPPTQVQDYHTNTHDQSRTCICTRESKQGGKVSEASLKADSEKNTELPRTGFEPVTTGLLVQCSAN